MEDGEQWIEYFIMKATKEQLQTLLSFMISNNYGNELINQLKIKIDESP